MFVKKTTLFPAASRCGAYVDAAWVYFIILEGLKLQPNQANHTDKKEYQIFLIYQEIQNGAVAKSYMTNGLLIYGEIFAHFLIRKPILIYDFATAPL
jgi:hypothetical protein